MRLSASFLRSRPALRRWVLWRWIPGLTLGVGIALTLAGAPAVAVGQGLPGSAAVLPATQPGNGPVALRLMVNDLQQAQQDFKERYGFSVWNVGTFPDGSSLASVNLADGSSLELVAMPKGFDGMTSKRGYPMGIALEVPDATAAALFLTERGMPYQGPMDTYFKGDAQRRPENRMMSFVTSTSGRFPYKTFYFQELVERNLERLRKENPEFAISPERKTHTNGAVGIKEVWVASQNPDRTVEALAKLGFPAPAPAWAMDRPAYRYPFNRGAILLVGPDPNMADDPVARQLLETGEGVLGITLSAAESKTLDTDDYGLRVALQPSGRPSAAGNP